MQRYAVSGRRYAFPILMFVIALALSFACSGGGGGSKKGSPGAGGGGGGGGGGTANEKPVLAPIPTPQFVLVGETLDIPISATDAEGDPISLWTSPLPPGATWQDLGGGSGLFSFTPTAAEIGDHIVEFRAVDDQHKNPVAQEVEIHAIQASSIPMEMASSNVIVAMVDTDDGEPYPPQDPGSWDVDGAPPLAVGRWSMPWWEGAKSDGYPITMRHHMYIEMATPLVSGQTYQVRTPYGTQLFAFDDAVTPCQSVHVNQVGYFEGSTERFANLGVWLGDAGARNLTPPVDYEVIEDASGAVVHAGQAVYRADERFTDAGSGEYVWRLDLGPVPPGGPYHIRVIGFGRSHSFGVGRSYTQQVARTVTRGLYHQRCGMALSSPYTQHTRGPCHLTVEVTDAEPPEFITLRGPKRSIRGGYHDAGDFDRRLNHTLIPAWMLMIYEAYPSRFADGDLNIPESGNGIPDWLDEILWGILVWEELQETDGAVRAGTEADGHPSYSRVNAATDTRVYRTYREDAAITAMAAGLFAHASRMLQPYDSSRAADLLNKAEKAWAWVGKGKNRRAPDAQSVYATCQLYLATGSNTHHRDMQDFANALPGLVWPERYTVWPTLEGFWAGALVSPYFFSYLITNRSTDPTISAWFTELLRHEAEDKILVSLAQDGYPLGHSSFVGYGSATGVGRYALPLMLMYRLTGDPKFVDGVSQIADYPLGLNPLGICYTTGLGTRSPRQPNHLDSYFTQEAGLGPVPGIVIYGPTEDPSSNAWEELVWQRVYPAYLGLPEQRAYAEGWSLIRTQEFTTKLIAINACMYSFLDMP